MNGRKQFTIVNGNVSTKLPIKFGIPQGSVLGPTLFVLFTNDLPSKVTEGTVYMYADDTTLFYIGRRGKWGYQVVQPSMLWTCHTEFALYKLIIIIIIISIYLSVYLSIIYLSISPLQWLTGDFKYETFRDQWIPLNSVSEVKKREQEQGQQISDGDEAQRRLQTRKEWPRTCSIHINCKHMCKIA